MLFVIVDVITLDHCHMTSAAAARVHVLIKVDRVGILNGRGYSARGGKLLLDVLTVTTFAEREMDEMLKTGNVTGRVAFSQCSSTLAALGLN